MSPYVPVFLYAVAYVLLFATWAAAVFFRVPGAEALIQYIQLALSALSGHLLTVINPKQNSGDGE